MRGIEIAVFSRTWDMDFWGFLFAVLAIPGISA
jgi:hypothetical protein